MAAKDAQYDVAIKGERLMQHNEQLANPLNPYAKAVREISVKRQKSEEDYWELSRREFQGGLYHDEKAGPYIPSHAVVKMLVEGASRRKLGKEFKRSVTVIDSLVPIHYDGPRERKALWGAKDDNGVPVFADMRLVGIGNKRTLRTRPLFRDWSIAFRVCVFGGAVAKEDLVAALDAAQAIGLGDGRPQYAGQFVVVSVKEVRS